MGKQRMRATMGSVLMIVGAVLLVSTIFLSWYTLSVSFNGQSGSIDLHPDNQIVLTEAGVTVTESFSSSMTGLNSTGMLYTAVEGLMIGGGILGFIGAILGFMLGPRPNLRWGAILCGILAFALGIIGPVALALAQPGTLSSDSHGSFFGGGTSGTGPTSSFFGSATVGGASETWGPAIGFYLAIVAAVIALVGAILVMMAHPERDADVTMAANQCGQCGATFSTPEELAAHAAQAHPPAAPAAMPPSP
ncbi:MAG: hypothetical protein L3J73_04045 [Thermoplasmata archaeon]|nr:hypothetical protein [Thermoplasmata archaeon]